MKKSIIAFAVLALLASCGKKESAADNLHLTGNIKGLKTGTLYIQRIVDTSLVAIDSVKIDGNASFERDIKLESPEMLYLFLDRGVTNSLDNNILFFAEPGTINIDTNLDSFINSAKITGSKNQELFEEYKKVNSRFIDENLTMVEARFKAIKRQDQKAIDSIDAKQQSNIKRKYLYATNFAINNKDHEVSPYIALAEIYDINIKFLDTIQKSMTPKVAQSLYGKKLTKYVADIKKEEQKTPAAAE
ncbi:protein of unknown function [Flavobacterium sp. CF108]|uniref:DUF4369 domain-containing protein n=1 Tax=unclassified Flavobacterium TaxID=196869 RepID=UPI0008CB3895|nr:MULTISPECIES: DUF4369 domain-containing protein [unclassified Flavobacterium]SEO47773.1 protein of unknown function [Flavobacterium sp. fv08]SHH71144.1 protein of unknown function [Flavobacterium sp. CF108]